MFKRLSISRKVKSTLFWITGGVVCVLVACLVLLLHDGDPMQPANAGDPSKDVVEWNNIEDLEPWQPVGGAYRVRGVVIDVDRKFEKLKSLTVSATEKIAALDDLADDDYTGKTVEIVFPGSGTSGFLQDHLKKGSEIIIPFWKAVDYDGRVVDVSAVKYIYIVENGKFYTWVGKETTLAAIESTGVPEPGKDDDKAYHDAVSAYIESIGYKVAVNSGAYLEIILPDSFDEVIQGIAIGEFLRERNELSKQNGFDFSPYLGKEVILYTYGSETDDDLILLIYGGEIVGAWKDSTRQDFFFIRTSTRPHLY